MHRVVSFVAVVFLLLGFASFVHDSQFPAAVVPIDFPDFGENVALGVDPRVIQLSFNAPEKLEALSAHSPLLA
jgi:hypothetical protein